MVPKTFDQLTSRRVLTTSWLEGEKLSQSQAGDIKQLVNLGVVCYLKQLLDTGFFHVSAPLLPWESSSLQRRRGPEGWPACRATRTPAT